MRTVRRTFSARRGKMQTRQGMKGGFDVKVRSSVKPICEKMQSYQEKRKRQNYLRELKHKQRQG